MKNSHLYFLLIITLFCKFIFAIQFPIFADEAYYAIWALKPQLSYFDHPGMVGWLINISKKIFISNSALTLRFPFLVLSFLTEIIWVLLFKKQNLSNKTIAVFLLFYNLNPLLGPGSVIATPDVPLVFFWSLSFFSYYQIFQSYEKAKKLLYYVLLGISLGLGFCSKYHIVLFVFSGFIDLIYSKKFKQLSIAGVLLTLLTGFICSLPVVIWNYQNEWSSFTFQLKHGFGKNHYDWHWTINYFLGQILIANPFIFGLLLKKQFSTSNKSIHKIFSLSQFIFFISSSFKAIVEANWPITAQAHTLLHTAPLLENPTNMNNNSSKKYFRFALGYWIIIYAGFVVFLNLDISKKVLRNQYRSTQIDEILPLVEKYKPLYGSSYQIASLLSWQSNTLIPKLNGLSRYDFFDTLTESKPTQNKIYVLKHLDSIWPTEYARYNKTYIDKFENLKVELFLLQYE